MAGVRHFQKHVILTQTQDGTFKTNVFRLWASHHPDTVGSEAAGVQGFGREWPQRSAARPGRGDIHMENGQTVHQRFGFRLKN